MKLEAVDHDSWTILRPSIAHNLELSCDGRKLARGRVAYFYCKFFHISFLRIILKWPRTNSNLALWKVLDPRSNYRLALFCNTITSIVTHQSPAIGSGLKLLND